MTGLRTPPPPRVAEQKHCFSCGRVLHITAVSCPHCRAAQPARSSAATPPFTFRVAHTAFCRSCGAPIHEQALACLRCGAMQHEGAAAGGKSRLAAALLAFLLGDIGAHKFYLGRPGWGVLYLLFCWTLIPWIAALVEGFFYLTQTDEAFARAHR